MVKSYSDEFVTELTNRLNEYSNKEANRPLCKELLLRKANGETFTLNDLDRKTLAELCVKEMCTDAMIGAIFGVDNRVIKGIRECFGYTDKDIVDQHTVYVLAKLASEVEEELGPSAFN